MKSYLHISFFCLLYLLTSIFNNVDAQISVEFSHKRGFYNKSFDLEVITSGYEVSVLYTIDGSDPAETSKPLKPLQADKFTIKIDRSTVVKVYAFNIEEKIFRTHSYILVDDVLNQNNNSVINELKYPSIWGYGTSIFGTTTCIRQNADYDMTIDACATKIDDYENRMRQGLMEIPTMSISLDKEHIFGPDSGIYVFPVEKPDTCYTLPEKVQSWERKASVEIFNDVQGSDTLQYQVNAGLQISGASTRYLDFYKHSFKLKFRSEYGAGKLKYPLYGENAAKKFESLQLRMIGHCSPHDWIDSRRAETQFHKDNWTRSIQRELSGYGSSTNGKFFHLFINGIYWGLYDVSERPDADYMAEYNEGSPKDYDIIKLLEVKSGTDSAYNYMHDLGHSIYDTILSNPQLNPWTGETEYYKEVVTNKTRAASFYSEIQNLLDIEKFMDYCLLNLYIVNSDWKENNWWAARNAKENGKFQYFVWDAEIVLNDAGKSNQVLLFAGNEGTNLKYHPIDLNQRLLDVPEYKIRYGDRIQCLCAEEDGVLNPDNFIESYKTSEQKIHNAALLEFARWGDARKLEKKYELICPDVIDETMEDYEKEVFPNLLKNMLVFYGKPNGEYNLFPYYVKKLKIDGEYVFEDVFNFEAVKFSKLGGEVDEGYMLKLTNPNIQINSYNETVPVGDIYYTTNGSDPRNIDGTISSSAIKYSGPIVIDEYKMIKARVFVSEFKYKDIIDKTLYNLWTTMCPREFFPKGYYDDLVINEIHYNPYVSDTVSGSKLEFIELKNIGDKDLKLSNTKFTEGIEYKFPLGKKISSNGYVLLATDSLAVKEHYNVKVDGQYSGKLANDGELIVLSKPNGDLINAVKYDDEPPWNIKADGKGASLSLYLELDDKVNNHLAENWGSSAGGATPNSENVFCLPITIEADAFSPSCYNGNDGFINLNITGGTQPYNIDWIAESAGNTNLVTNLSAGTYEVKITDDQSCSESKKITIANPKKMQTNLHVTHTTSANSNDGIAVVKPSNVPNGYTIMWSDGTTGNTNNNLAPGENYWVSITDYADNTCTITESFSVEVTSNCIMPTNFSAIATMGEKAIITWSGKSGNTNYTVSYKTTDENKWTTKNTLSPNLILSGLKPCKTYEYIVSAACNNVISNNSTVKTFTTTGCEEACSAYSVNGNTINVTNNSAFILWEIVPQAKYRLNYSKNGINTWHQYETSNNFSILFGLDDCANYDWYVEVICPDGRITQNNIIHNFTTANCAKKANLATTNNEELSDFDFSIYPNPAKDFIKVSSKNINHSIKSEILIYDFSGKLVKNRSTFSGETTLDITNLTPNMYIVKIVNENKSRHYKFLKEQ